MTAFVGYKPVTAKDFAKFDPEWRYDLIEGMLMPMPPLPGAEHGALAQRTIWKFDAGIRQRGLGETFAAETRFLVQRSPDTVIASDWAFVRSERMPAVLPKGILELAPDIVLEVRSPSDRAREVDKKVRLWLRAGVRLVWELNPRTRVLTIYRHDGTSQALGVGDVLAGEDVLPGFEHPIAEIFA